MAAVLYNEEKNIEMRFFKALNDCTLGNEGRPQSMKWYIIKTVEAATEFVEFLLHYKLIAAGDKERLKMVQMCLLKIHIIVYSLKSVHRDIMKFSPIVVAEKYKTLHEKLVVVSAKMSNWEGKNIDSNNKARVSAAELVQYLGDILTFIVVDIINVFDF